MNRLPKKMPQHLGRLSDQKAIEIATLGATIALGRMLDDVIDMAIKLASSGGVDKEHRVKAEAARKTLHHIVDVHKSMLNNSIDNLNEQIDKAATPGRKEFIDSLRMGTADGNVRKTD